VRETKDLAPALALDLQKAGLRPGSGVVSDWARGRIIGVYEILH
jgi:hypothetical protein